MTRTDFGIGFVSMLIIVTSATASRAQQSTGGSRLKEVEGEVAELKSELDTLMGSKTAEETRVRLDRMADDIRALRQTAAQAVLEKDAAEAEAARSAAETERLASEVAVLQQTVEKLHAEVEDLVSSPTSGYDRGFFLRSKDGKFSLRVNGHVRPVYTLALMQLHNEAGESEPSSSSSGDTQLRRTVAENGFEMETARLALSVSLLEKLVFDLSVDFGTLSGETIYPVNAAVPEEWAAAQVGIRDRAVVFMDAFGEYKAADVFLIRAGQFKVPFDLESAFEDGSLVFTNRSLMTRRYFVYAQRPAVYPSDAMYGATYDLYDGASFGRDVGAMVGGTAFDGRFDYHVGAWNGAGLNRENDNRDVLAAGRIAVSPLGDMSMEMSDTEGTESPRVSVGLGVAYDLPLHRNPAFPETTYNSSDVSTTLDVATKWRGVSAFASIFYRYSDHGVGLSEPDETLHSLGTAVQAAYFISAIRLEPALRYSFFSARLGDRDSVHEAAAAVNYHVVKEHLRVGIEYRGLFPIEKHASYLSPEGVIYDNRHEISLSAEVGF